MKMKKLNDMELDMVRGGSAEGEEGWHYKDEFDTSEFEDFYDDFEIIVIEGP